jgi:hypothetical protein
MSASGARTTKFLTVCDQALFSQLVDWAARP